TNHFMMIASRELNRTTSIESTDENSAMVLNELEEPPLLPGEKIVNNLKGREVTFICPFLGAIRGILSVTNYKLYFKSSASYDSPTPLIIDVPLCTVARIEKIGGSTSKGENSYGIDLICKDMRN